MAATSKPPLPPPANPLPLAPRIDRLDSIVRPTMKVLEEQKNVTRRLVDSNQKKTPMDAAIREAQLKGSIMDRVRSLENRLLQLCLEIESRGTPLPDSSVFQVSKNATSNQGEEDNKKGSIHSSMEFMPNLYHQAEKIESKTNSKQKKAKNEANDPMKKSTISGEEQKSVVTKKKGKHSTWFHFKLLGC